MNPITEFLMHAAIVYLFFALATGCTPLAGYVHTYPGIQSAVGKSQIAEMYERFAEVERLEAGYPPSRRGIQPCRKEFEGPKCPE